MSFYIQDPAGSSGHLLHDSILNEASKAIEGGGAFAFATKGGIELLIKSTEFRSLLSRGQYTLIVGIDAITNTSAIETLKYYQDKYPSLLVKAFYHEENGVIFHPKFTWFRNSVEQDEGSLIIGSGNLTLKGLRKNWEAYFVTPLMKAQFKQTDDVWQNWLSSHTEFLFDLDHEKVTKKAEENKKEFDSKFAKKVKEKNKKTEGQKNKPKIILDKFQLQNNRYSLIEVPVGRKSGTPSAYTQANLGKILFEEFFDIDIDKEPEIFYFQHVEDNGETEELEDIRPIIKKESSNYNFRLDATKDKGKPEPKTPPICIFTEIGVRTYRYKFLLPRDNTYKELRAFLLSQPRISTGGRKLIGNQADLYSIIPTAPYLSSLLAEEL
tara:strand:+ start:2421 stop:3563 length:1143 start_codon:yes stop_codon:yes gene_type:complete